jgi:hypothetical protein
MWRLRFSAECPDSEFMNPINLDRRIVAESARIVNLPGLYVRSPGAAG